MADETTRLILDIIGRDRGGKKALTDVGRAAEDASDEVKGLDKASDKAGTSLKDLGKDADKLGTEIKKTEKNIQELAKQIKADPGDSGLFKQLNKEQAQLRKLLRVQDLVSEKDGQAAGGKLVAGLRQKFSELPAVGKKGIGALGAAAGTAALGAGVAAGALLMEGITASLEKSKADSILRAQLGKSVPAAGDVGKLSGKIYADNFGDSIQDVNTALKNVIRQGLVDARKASKSEIVGITEDVLTVATVAEESTDRVAAATTQLVRTGLARNITEALDQITTASQIGVDKAGDLLDTITEYSTQFRKLGLQGPEALGLLSQGLKAGARDADTVADSLKELSIRAVDGSKTTVDAFKSLNLSADTMRDRFAAGGLAAKGALDEVLTRLRQVRDPAERARIQVELFGTKAEDLGDALNALDLDTAAREMDGFAGSTEKAQKAIASGTGAETAAALRKIKTEAIDMGNRISDSLIGLAKFVPGVKKLLGESGDEAEKAAEKVRPLAERNDFVARAFQHVQDAAKGFNESLTVQTRGLKDAATAADGLKGALDLLTGANVDASRAESDYRQAVADATAAVDGHVDKIDLGTQKGRDYNTQLLRIRDTAIQYAQALYDQTGDQNAANKVIQDGRTQLYNTARQMGLSETAAWEYVNQILKIPQNWTTNVNIPTKGPLANVKTIQRAINDIHGKTVGIHVSGPGGSGTQVAGAAKGEYITGPGPKGKDSVLRVVAPGEYIVPSEDVDAAGGKAGFESVLDSLHGVRPPVGQFRGGGAPVIQVVFAVGPRATSLDEAALWTVRKAIRSGTLSLKVTNGRVSVG